MQSILPTKPRHLDPLAVELLEGIATCPSASSIVLGGYFALKHYHDYRVSHDVDAWWSESANEQQREETRRAVHAVLTESAARRGLSLCVRRFGDTEAWELRGGGSTVFSFQISARTLQLEPPLPSPWLPLQIETLADNLGAKMNALAQRGAPRDFLDIYELVRAGLVTAADCWGLWQRKNPDLTLLAARAEVRRHLEALEKRRPLTGILDAGERDRAAQVRAWFRDFFLASAPP